MVGLSPKGRVVPEAMVRVVSIDPLVLVRLIVTRLKLTPGASTEVLAVYVPDSATVPPLASKVGEPVLVKLLVTFIVPDVEVKEPPESEKFPFRFIAESPPAKVPPAWE